MLVLVTNSIQPYCYDAAKILGLPSGADYRFRYRKRWLSSDCDLGQIIDKEAVVVLRNFDDASLTPVRLVTVTDLQILGDVYFFEFVTSSYLNANTHGKLTGLIADKIRQLGIQNLARNHLNRLVFDVDTSALGSSYKASLREEVNIWDELITVFGKIFAFHGFSFFKILGVKSARGESMALVRDGGIRAGLAYSVRPDTVYFLEVLQKIGTDKGLEEPPQAGFVIKLASPDLELTVLRGAQKVFGQYDVLKFSFRTPSIHSTRYLSIDLEKVGKELEDIGEPLLTFRLRLAHSWFDHTLAAVRVIGIMCGLSFMLFADWLSSTYGWGVSVFNALALALVVLGANRWDDFLKKAVEPTRDLRM